jgi:hypothetical protein
MLRVSCFHFYVSGAMFVDLVISIKVFSPTDGQLDSLKNNFKFALKLTLKASACFIVKNTILREHTV